MYRKLENMSSPSLFSSSWQHKAVSLEGRHFVPYGRLAGMLVLSEAVFWVLRVFRFCFFCCILNLNLVPATRFSLVHLEDHNVSLRESTAVLPVH